MTSFHYTKERAVNTFKVSGILKDIRIAVFRVLNVTFANTVTVNTFFFENKRFPINRMVQNS